MNLLTLMGAPAQAGQEATGSMAVTLVVFLLIMGIFYFLMIRPQRKKDKEAKAMLDALKKGDKVVTIGGIHGTVVAVKDNSVIVKVDDSARIEFSKNAISTVVTKEGANNSPASDKEKAKKDKKAAKEEVKEVKEEVKEVEEIEKEETKDLNEEAKEIEKENK